MYDQRFDESILQPMEGKSGCNSYFSCKRQLSALVMQVRVYYTTCMLDVLFKTHVIDGAILLRRIDGK